MSDNLDESLSREVMKNNLHRVMLDNAELVGKFLSIRTDAFMQACWEHGVLNKTETEQLLKMLMNAKILQVMPLPK